MNLISDSRNPNGQGGMLSSRVTSNTTASGPAGAGTVVRMFDGAHSPRDQHTQQLLIQHRMLYNSSACASSIGAASSSTHHNPEQNSSQYYLQKGKATIEAVASKYQTLMNASQSPLPQVPNPNQNHNTDPVVMLTMRPTSSHSS